jgi:hypothetical protein
MAQGGPAAAGASGKSWGGGGHCTPGDYRWHAGLLTSLMPLSKRLTPALNWWYISRSRVGPLLFGPGLAPGLPGPISPVCTGPEL